MGFCLGISWVFIGVSAWVLLMLLLCMIFCNFKNMVGDWVWDLDDGAWVLKKLFFSHGLFNIFCGI